ncbi:MAG: hypothetical protein Q8O46_00425, partial [bacterium]|nr:hypothetical protein [bacterium]
IAALWDKYGIGKVAWVAKKPVSDAADYITKHVAKNWGRRDGNEMLEAFLHYTGMRQWTSSKGAVPKLPESIEHWELINFAFSPGEALIYREEMLEDEVKLIRDDLEKNGFTAS